MRWLFRLLCVCALGVTPVVGCLGPEPWEEIVCVAESECCEDVECNDGNACTIDLCRLSDGVFRCVHPTRQCQDRNDCTYNRCDPDEGCYFPNLPNKTPCADGTCCQDGRCVWDIFGTAC